MPSFTKTISGLKSLRQEMRGAIDDSRSLVTEVASTRAELDASRKHITEFGDHVVDSLDRVKKEATPRIKDLEFDLENMSEQGNAWATSLLDIVRQVQKGTVDAGKAIESMGDGVILFEGQLRSVKDVLLDVLPTTGQVQKQIQELSEELKNADMGEVIDRLKGQYNQYADLLAQTVQAFTEGKVTLERVLQLAQQVENLLPGSETEALAERIKEGLLGGTL